MGEDRQNNMAPDLRKAASLQTEKRARFFGTNYGTIYGTNDIKLTLIEKTGAVCKRSITKIVS